MISLYLEVLRVTTAELGVIAGTMATALERSEGWPASAVGFRSKEEPEDDPDRMPGTFYSAWIEGLPRGATLSAESKGLPHRGLRLQVKATADAAPILAALREAFAAHAGSLTWLTPAALPDEWARFQNESTAVLGVRAGLPSTFVLTEGFRGLRFGYVHADLEEDPTAAAQRGDGAFPTLTELRHAIPVGPIPDGESASSLITTAGRVPTADELLAALLGDAGTRPRAELVSSGTGPAFPFARAQPKERVRMETWAAGPWRIRIGRSTGEDPRFQLAVQPLGDGDRALFASSEMQIWKKTSGSVTASACAPSSVEASAMVQRLLECLSRTSVPRPVAAPLPPPGHLDLNRPLAPEVFLRVVSDPRFSALPSLRLRGRTGHRDSFDACLDAFSLLPFACEELVFDEVSASRKAWAKWARAPGLRQLKRLGLKFDTLQDFDDRAFAALVNSIEGLEVLSFFWLDFTLAKLEALVASPMAQTLESLCLGNSAITPPMVDLLLAARFPRLQRLHLRELDVSGPAEQLLRSHPNRPALRDLEIKRYDATVWVSEPHPAPLFFPAAVHRYLKQAPDDWSVHQSGDFASYPDNTVVETVAAHSVVRHSLGGLRVGTAGCQWPRCHSAVRAR